MLFLVRVKITKIQKPCSEKTVAIKTSPNDVRKRHIVCWREKMVPCVVTHFSDKTGRRFMNLPTVST